MLPEGVLGRIRFPWGNSGNAVATLGGDPPKWKVEVGNTVMSEESRAHVERHLNEFFDPVKNYRGPSDGPFAGRIINEAAEHLHGAAEFPPAPPEVPGRVY
jgi:hypothetical protein